MAAYVRDLIFNGNLKPGERIDQDGIADTLQVSKLPVREALITLEGSGLVDITPRRGAFVSQITREDLIDHYKIYGVISMIATERAATALGSRGLVTLHENVAAMKAAAYSSERERLNYEFHRAINSAGSTHRLRVMFRGLETMMFGEFYRDEDGWTDTAVDDHARVADALERGDAAAAAEHMRRHIEDGGAHAIAILEQRGFWDDPA